VNTSIHWVSGYRGAAKPHRSRGAKLQITEAEARQYYLANREQFVEPASVTFREILVELPAGAQTGAGVHVAADDEARVRSQALIEWKDEDLGEPRIIPASTGEQGRNPAARSWSLMSAPAATWRRR